MDTTTDTKPFDVIETSSREEWLKARETLGIGSSDVPALLGISRWKSPYVLFHEKIGIQPPSRGEQEQRNWGLILEEPIAQRYSEETRRIVERPQPWTLARSKAHPFMVASVDRFILSAGVVDPPAGGAGVLEIKNAHLYMRDQWDDDVKEPPLEYLVQLQHQLAVTGLAWGSIAALVGGCIFLWQDVPRDDALIDRLVEIENDFMHRIGTMSPPPVDGHETTKALLKMLHPKDDGTAVSLPPEAIDTTHELLDVKAQIKQLEGDQAKLENRLKAWIGDATLGVLTSGGGWSFKIVNRTGYTVQPTSFRTLRLLPGTKPKGK